MCEDTHCVITEAYDFEEALVNFYEYYGANASLSTRLFKKLIYGEGSKIAIGIFERDQGEVRYFGIISPPFKSDFPEAKRVFMD